MITFNKKEQLVEYLNAERKNGMTIGLVPTMGALHQGHLSLIAASKKACDLTVATIFVNPTQFNNPEDLSKYPKPIERDQLLLESSGCDVLFNPEIEEMYETDEVWDYNVGALNEVLEGAFRPGHYKGVTQIVYKLFKLVAPDRAFFGQKDYQQFLVIAKLTQDFGLNINLKACQIIREDDGLAMSSRNIRLNSKERSVALQLYKSLAYIKQHYGKASNNELLKQAKEFYVNSLLDLEYLEIVDRETLKPISKTGDDAIVLVACAVGNTRLIDNMMLP